MGRRIEVDADDLNYLLAHYYDEVVGSPAREHWKFPVLRAVCDRLASATRPPGAEVHPLMSSVAVPVPEPHDLAEYDQLMARAGEKLTALTGDLRARFARLGELPGLMTMARDLKGLDGEQREVMLWVALRRLANKDS